MKVVEAMEDGTIAGAEGPKRINLPSNAFARADPITRVEEGADTREATTREPPTAHLTTFCKYNL